MIPTDDLSILPPGSVLHLGYTCAACGTHYEWDSRTQRRRVVEHPAEGISQALDVVLAPGESASIPATLHMPDFRQN